MTVEVCAALARRLHRAAEGVLTDAAARQVMRDAAAALVASGSPAHREPPTAGEVLAHIKAGGRVQCWSLAHQWWEKVWRSSVFVAEVLPQVDPSTPQPGLRLVPAAVEADRPETAP